LREGGRDEAGLSQSEDHDLESHFFTFGNGAKRPIFGQLKPIFQLLEILN